MWIAIKAKTTICSISFTEHIRKPCSGEKHSYSILTPLCSHNCAIHSGFWAWQGALQMLVKFPIISENNCRNNALKHVFVGVCDLYMAHESTEFQGFQKANFKNLIWLLKDRTISLETPLQLHAGRRKPARRGGELSEGSVLQTKVFLAPSWLSCFKQLRVSAVFKHPFEVAALQRGQQPVPRLCLISVCQHGQLSWKQGSWQLQCTWG